MSSNGYAEDRNKKSKILGGILIAVIIILIVTLAFIGYKMLNPKKESPEVEQQTEQKVLNGNWHLLEVFILTIIKEKSSIITQRY